MGDIKFKDEHGWWNPIKSEDRTAAINAFNNDAKRYAAQADFVKDAQQAFETKIREIMRAHGKSVTIEYSGEEKINLP